MPLLPTEGPSIGKQGARGKTHLHSTALLPSCSMGHESAVSRTQWVPWLSSLAYKGSEDKTVIAKIQVEASLCNPTGIPEPGRPSPAKKAEGQLRRSGPRAGQEVPQGGQAPVWRPGWLTSVPGSFGGHPACPGALGHVEVHGACLEFRPHHPSRLPLARAA